MAAVLTRQAIREQLERFATGCLAREALAAWAFDQFYDEAEGQLAYEAGFDEIIDGVLEELAWADFAPFRLDPMAARRLQQRLDEATAGSREAGVRSQSDE